MIVTNASNKLNNIIDVQKPKLLRYRRTGQGWSIQYREDMETLALVNIKMKWN